MIYHRERLVHGQVSGEQIVQLFDDVQDMASTVAGFLDEGRREGASLLVVARATHCAALTSQLEALGWPVDQLVTDGHLVVLDAAMTLAAFWREGEPERERFEARVGDQVRELAARSRVRIYSEMVDVLAEHGSYVAAEAVDAFWKRLAHECSLQILYGYASARFTDRHREPALDDILGTHPSSQSESSDLVEAWLLAERQSRYHTD